MNTLVLAVAGGRKTQSIVERCVSAPHGRKILVLTYTQRNQLEITDRLARHRPLAASVHVSGWFSHLLGDWVRPYVPLRFDGARLAGLNFEGDPGMYATDHSRFLDSEDRAFKRHLAQLAIDVCAASDGAVLDRLARIYDDIYIDEVQDLNGYDLEIVGALMGSPIALHLVGDVRQALIHTNVRDPKNKQYKGVKIKQWFDEQATKGRLDIAHEFTTWRSNAAIAEFADTIFPAAWGFAPTVSKNVDETGHDGVFAVATEHVDAYVEAFQPVCLRYSAGSATHLDLPFMNIGIAKGMGVDRVLIGPTAGVVAFVSKGKALGDSAACSLYVAVTRARASVAFVLENPSKANLPIWSP